MESEKFIYFANEKYSLNECLTNLIDVYLKNNSQNPNYKDYKFVEHFRTTKIKDIRLDDLERLKNLL